jgi:hypothetical protein
MQEILMSKERLEINVEDKSTVNEVFTDLMESMQSRPTASDQINKVWTQEISSAFQRLDLTKYLDEINHKIIAENSSHASH